MPIIIVKHGADTVHEFEILKSETIIGRDPRCDIVLNNQEISGKHTRIIFQDQILTLIDLKSRKGTYLNGKKISEAVLNYGDIINISIFTLIAKEKYESTATLNLPIKTTSIGYLKPGGENRKLIQIFVNSSIGRDRQSDIQISDEYASRRHAVFSKEDDIPVIIDNHTPNGTQVNGRLISGKSVLSNGDQISIGSQRWIFQTDASDQSTSSDKKKTVSKKSLYISIPVLAILIILLLVVSKKNNKENIIPRLIRQAETLETKGEYVQSKDALKKALSIDPGNQALIKKIDAITERIEVEREMLEIQLRLNAAGNDEELFSVEKSIDAFRKKYPENDSSQSFSKQIKQRIDEQKILDEYDFLYEAGKYNECVQMITQTNHPRRVYYIIKAKKAYAIKLESTNRLREAKEEWQSILSYDSNDADAKQAIARFNTDLSQPMPGNAQDLTAQNAVPIVGQITKTKGEVITGEKITFSLNASDKENDPLFFKWNATRGEIQNEGNKANYLAMFDVKPPQETVVITCTVKDNFHPPIFRKTVITVKALYTTSTTQSKTVPVPDEQTATKLSVSQAEEAEKLYLTAYRKMQYKTKESYLEAMQLFEKVRKMATDPNSELYQKADKKIEQIKQDLNTM